MPTYF
jgi:hypothetical protein